MKNLVPAIIFLLLASSCSVSKPYNPATKFSPQQLREDYRIFRQSLEEAHPSLYWFTPKDSMDLYFAQGEAKLGDSLPEYKFRYVLSYVLSKIRCGHTSVRPSKAAARYAERVRSVSFPLGLKLWKDTAVVVANLNRRDSLVKRGSLLLSIEGRPVQQLIDSMFSHLSTDGYNTTHKYQVLSNGSSFRNFYAALYGLRPRMEVSYLDTAGNLRTAALPVFNPLADTPRPRIPLPQLTKRERKKINLNTQRSMRIDTSLQTAFLEVNTFSKNYRLRGFFRRSFREIRKKGIENLVVDMRGNGGGSVNLSNLLTKYIADKPFKIADSLYAITNKSRYKQYRGDYFLNRLFFIFMVRKKKDGLYHFAMFENKYFKPKKNNHFSGTTYILTGGNTFSAASLFTKALKPQPDVVVVGEETGGGAYGNTAWLIPDVTLPNTKVRFRLPLFRLVVDSNETKGRGIIPEVEAGPTVESIRRNTDYKIEKVAELIKAKNRS